MARSFAARYRVKPGQHVRLARHNPADLSAFPDKDKAERQSLEDVAGIDKLQDRLYAEGRRALLVVLQGIDTAGKDGTQRRRRRDRARDAGADESEISPAEVGYEEVCHQVIGPHVQDRHVCFSNRLVGVKHFQAIHHSSVDVARGLVLLFGIGTKALPSWDSRTRWNNLYRGLVVE
jgi:hypothetical protein